MGADDVNRIKNGPEHTFVNATLRFPLLAKSGTHHLRLYVGQPPTLRTLIVDTGSRLSAWTCHPCPTCQKGERYNPSKSSTSSLTLENFHLAEAVSCVDCHFKNISVCSKKDTCRLEQRYTEGSTWQADEVNDLVSVSVGAHSSDYEESLFQASFPFTFGCQTKLSGLFATQWADGILGMAHSPYSLHSALIEAVYPDRNNTSQFSLCLSRDNGFMAVGGVLLERHRSAMEVTPMIQSMTVRKGMYGVKVTQLWMNDTCIGCHKPGVVNDAFNTGKGTILDSGTTDTYLPKRLSQEWKQAWKNQTGSNEDVVTLSSPEDVHKFPTIRVILENNVTLTLRPENYMENTEKTKWTCRIYVDEPNGAVLGINSMVDHNVLFDWQAGLVGVAPADCD